MSAILAHPTITAAAEEIDVHPRTISRWFKEPAFAAEYLGQMSDLQLELWRQMLTVRNEVWNRFLELTRSDDERIAIRATIWFLDRMLSVPAILTRSADELDEIGAEIPPKLRAFLEGADADAGSEGATG